MLYVWITLGVLVLVFLVWRITSVSRGARQRDELLMQQLDPIGESLASRKDISPEKIANLAERAELRPMLYALLKHFEKLNLFPPHLLSLEAQAEAFLAYWMMHPNELQAPPERMDLVETFDHRVATEPAKIFVFRYRMAPGHWAGEDWLLGVVGPALVDPVPYDGMIAFSRAGDKQGEVSPRELVDWWLGMLKKKRMLPEE